MDLLLSRFHYLFSKIMYIRFLVVVLVIFKVPSHIEKDTDLNDKFISY